MQTLWPGGSPNAFGSTYAVIDIALRPESKTYGVPSPGARSYAWAVPAHPGVLPRIGEAAFAVQVEATPPATSPGILGIAALPANVPVAGIVVLLDPLSLALFWNSVPPSGLVSLPVPGGPELVGHSVYLQTFHIEAGLLGASNGLSVTVMN